MTIRLAIERIGSLPRLDLGVGVDECHILALDETLDGGFLCVEAETAAALRSGNERHLVHH